MRPSNEPRPVAPRLLQRCLKIFSPPLNGFLVVRRLPKQSKRRDRRPVEVLLAFSRRYPEHAGLFRRVINGLRFPFDLNEEYFCPLGVLVGDLAHILEPPSVVGADRCRPAQRDC